MRKCFPNDSMMKVIVLESLKLGQPSFFSFFCIMMDIRIGLVLTAIVYHDFALIQWESLFNQFVLNLEMKMIFFCSLVTGITAV